MVPIHGFVGYRFTPLRDGDARGSHQASNGRPTRAGESDLGEEFVLRWFLTNFIYVAALKSVPCSAIYRLAYGVGYRSISARHGQPKE